MWSCWQEKKFECKILWHYPFKNNCPDGKDNQFRYIKEFFLNVIHYTRNRGESHEILDFRFFFINQSPKPMSIPLGLFQNSRRYLQLKVHHRFNDTGANGKNL